MKELGFEMPSEMKAEPIEELETLICAVILDNAPKMRRSSLSIRKDLEPLENYNYDEEYGYYDK